MKNNFIKRIMTLGVIGVTLLGFGSVGASAEWRNNDKGWEYYNNGNLVSNSWFYDKDTKTSCYLDSQGHRVIGWMKDKNSKWYYFNEKGVMLHDTMVDNYKLGSDGAWIESTTITNELIPIPITTIPSNWEQLTSYGYILGNGSALAYQARDLNGISSDEVLKGINTNITQNADNYNVYTIYKKYNGYDAMCYEYKDFSTLRGTQKNCLIVVTTNTRVYNFMLQGDNNYSFDLDRIDLEYVLKTSLNIK